MSKLKEKTGPASIDVNVKHYLVMLVAGASMLLLMLNSAMAQTPAKRYAVVNGIIMPFDGFVAPNSPEGVTATLVLPDNGLVAWNAVDDADRYRLELQDYLTRTWSTAYEGSNTSFTVQSLPIGRHTFRVFACGGQWCSKFSNYVNIDIGPQNDSDLDGVLDYADQCPETPIFHSTDNQGCSIWQRDSDADGVNDAIDLCPDTEVGVTVSAAGCIPTTEDSDNDGITNDLDRCDGTAPNSTPDSDGCAGSQLDSDFDGLTDDVDPYPLQSATQCIL